MKTILFVVLFAAVAVFILRATLARAQGVNGFMANNQKTADALTDEKLNRFLVFWKVREEFSRRATPSVLRGLRDGGLDGALSVATSSTNTQVFTNAEEAAAAQSGLTVREGMALFMLLSTHYMGVYSATMHSDVASRERDLASRREAFRQMYGTQALALVTRHEDQFIPLVTKQMEAYKEQMRAVGP